MKTKISILLVITLLLLFSPTSVCANSVPPGPYDIDIAIDDASNISYVSFWVSVDDYDFLFLKEIFTFKETRLPNEKIVSIYNRNTQYKSFKIKVHFRDASSVESNPVEFKEWGSYAYNTTTNKLTQRAITSWLLEPHITAFTLILPLLLASFAAWLLSKAFQLNPGKYVAIAHLITNTLLNILVLVFFNKIFIEYYLLLFLLELIITPLAFGFYVLKYKQYTKRRLLLFSIAASLVNWGVYLLTSYLYLNS